ncbi:hypothetical protein RHMOL_Rhmol13G0182000 [Rhododendron molle]|uniref:Uncharacterized protein n=2 Tax=Rhododendron molle TaxID=49168 RepID=A0ACC0L9D9_RHOML|nr:hypothetical protein RHMOL_Rhmol13G0182000 [Rhododendron molle]
MVSGFFFLIRNLIFGFSSASSSIWQRKEEKGSPCPSLLSNLPNGFSDAICLKHLLFSFKFLCLAHLKGKDDSPAKSKNGRKVQFDSEDSLESEINLSSKAGGKGDTPLGKGDWGKGGKGDKFANGGKSSMPKGSSTSGQKNEQELPKNAKCLMDCEAADILLGIQEQMVVLSEDPTIKIPIPFDRGLQYAKNGSRYTDPESVRRVLEPLKAHGVSDSEICMIANICPESLDEVFALISSLKV